MTEHDEFTNRVYCLGLLSTQTISRLKNQINIEEPSACIDMLYENGKFYDVIVFNTAEDCTAFTLKHEKNYG